MTPKTNIGAGSYSLQVTTAAGYQAKLASGKTVADGYGSDPEAKPTTAQTAEEIADWCSQSPTISFAIDQTGYTEEIADWCSQSPTISFAIDQTGYTKQQHVDFGGNVDAVFDRAAICEYIFGFFGFDTSQCYD